MKITIIKPHASFLVAHLQARYPHLEQVVGFSDGIAGLSAIRSDAPDIAIVDMDVAGLTALKEMKTKGAGLKFFLMSEWQTFAHEAKQFGAKVFLTKPFSMDAFLNELEPMIAAVEKEKRKIRVPLTC